MPQNGGGEGDIALRASCYIRLNFAKQRVDNQQNRLFILSCESNRVFRQNSTWPNSKLDKIRRSKSRFTKPTAHYRQKSQTCPMPPSAWRLCMVPSHAQRWQALHFIYDSHAGKYIPRGGADGARTSPLVVVGPHGPKARWPARAHNHPQGGKLQACGSSRTNIRGRQSTSPEV